jgi:phosphonate transport system permease protein
VLSVAWPPAHSAEFLWLVFTAIGETLAMATLGVMLALLPAIPLCLIASRATLTLTGSQGPVRTGIGKSVRGLLLVVRSIPEIVWALLLVHATGLGITAGVMALVIVYSGMLGKVFADILESSDLRPLRMLRLSGSPLLPALLYGGLPQVRREMLSYLIYRWECAVRTSAVLGFVGAGGLGQQLSLSIRMLALDEILTIVMAFALLVILAEYLSDALRRWTDRASGARGVPLALLSATLLSLWMAPLDLASVFSAQGIQSMGRYLGNFFPPVLDAGLLAPLGHALFDTAWMSVGSLVLAVSLALPLSLPAAGRYGPWAKRLTRSVMNLVRALPELVWAALIVLWVGLGPVAGMLALGIYTGGVLGRLFADALENHPDHAEKTLILSGASRLTAFLYGTLPALWPQWLAYALYRWEHNIRMASIMGFVGAGGLGQMLHISLGLFQESRATVVIVAMMLLVFASDALSRRSRDGKLERERLAG